MDRTFFGAIGSDFELRGASEARLARIQTGPWTTYVPTLAQGAATVNKTVTYARYVRFGQTCIVQGDLACTSNGSSGTDVTVGLPLPAAATALATGIGAVYNASAGLYFKGGAEIVSSTTVKFFSFHSTALGFLGSVSFTGMLSPGDLVRYYVTYEVA
ncbi:MAG TPA: hypothetical protein VEG38_16625 [Acidimicrobiia bacterium]|nr:hypothetical protein [Acidimicrobiia bacterium]